MIQYAQIYTEYKGEDPGLPSHPLQEPIESTRFPDKTISKYEVRRLLRERASDPTTQLIEDAKNKLNE